MSSMAIFVTGAPLASQAALSALRFCIASEAAGVKVSQVFFYSEAAAVANKMVTPIDDELNLSEAWADFAQRTGTPLAVCIASSERRGVLDQASLRENIENIDSADTRASDQSLVKAATLAAGFQVTGLGVFHDAMLAANRLVTFR